MSNADSQDSNREAQTLRRVSSLILNSPVSSARRLDSKVASGEENVQHASPKVKQLGTLSTGEEVVPDSEEERRCESVRGERIAQIIEISSDEDEVPFSKPRVTIPTTVRKFNTPRARRIVQSSSSEDSDNELTHLRQEREVIELTDSSPERAPRENDTTKATPNIAKKLTIQTEKPLPLYIDDGEPEDEPWAVNDGSILILNEPRSARKPTRIPLSPRAGQSTPSSSRRIRSAVPVSPSTEVVDSPATKKTPDVFASTPNPSPTKKRAPRETKKSQAAAEQARREAYAQELFAELNKTVFNDGLPKDTKLNWSKRLLSTAGKARWHRDREGVETSEIELAIKVLDCEERIRNTLSHEMCHLACWVINGDIAAGHGSAWKAWATKVMRKRPEIKVTTKHSYDISYPFEWKCLECSKIYGRFSKSIRPDECVCGACKTGKLIPLFAVSSRATTKSKTAVGSKLAAEKTQDSPRPLHRPGSPQEDVGIGSRTEDDWPPSPTIPDTESELEVDILTTTFDNVHLK